MRKEEFYREALPDSLGPLEGVKVLEATTAQAGPVAGMVLADLGALVAINLSSVLMWVVALRKVRPVVGRARARARVQERVLVRLGEEKMG